MIFQFFLMRWQPKGNLMIACIFTSPMRTKMRFWNTIFCNFHAMDGILIGPARMTGEDILFTAKMFWISFIFSRKTI